MNNSYEKLPLVDLSATKVLGRKHRRANGTASEIITQNSEDAANVLKLVDLDANLRSDNIIESRDKFLVETQSDSVTTGSTSKSIAGIMKKGLRKPHYTRLLIFEDKLVFQAACCLPLKVFAASLDGNVVSGRALFSSHSKENGGKLAYEFAGKGTEMIIDLKRGESTRAQRLVFKI